MSTQPTNYLQVTIGLLTCSVPRQIIKASPVAWANTCRRDFEAKNDNANPQVRSSDELVRRAAAEE